MSKDTQLEMNGSVPGRNEIMAAHGEPPRHEHGVTIQQEAREERSGMLDTLFATYQSASDQAKKEVSSLNSPDWAGYESRSVLLRKNSVHSPKTASLTDQVRKLGL